ncbi:MAG: ABC transporter ATP-binding protein/permease [Candidatus Hydrogenedentes bacterium]|nr:ABC transporter ATP-binding protein/permease [Candidatus Hydrogenedentota bacterium]
MPNDKNGIDTPSNQAGVSSAKGTGQDATRPAVAPADPGPSIQRSASPPSSGSDSVPYLKMYRWGIYIIKLAPIAFLLGFVMRLASPQLMLINAKIFQGATTISQEEELKGAASRIFNALGISETLSSAAFLILFFGLFFVIFSIVNKMLFSFGTNVMTEHLQQDLHDKLLRMGPTYHKKHDFGKTSLVVTRFSTGAQMLLTELYTTPCVIATSLVTGFWFLKDAFDEAQIPTWIFFLFTAAIIAIPFGPIWIGRFIRSAYTRVRDKNTAVMSEFTNSGTAPLEIQLMGAEQQRSRSFREKVHAYFKEQYWASFKNDLAMQMQEGAEVLLKAVFVFVAAYYVGVELPSGSTSQSDTAEFVPAIYVVAGPPSDVAIQPAVKSVAFAGQPAGAPGDTGSKAKSMAAAIVGFLLILPLVISPMKQIATFITGIQTTWPQVQSVVELLEEEPEVTEKPGAVALAPTDAQIQLKNVTFSYSPGGRRILDDLSHTFPAGKISAIVAPSGEGKSSILNLIVRLRDPQSGAILIGEKDISDLTFASLRTNIAKVSQFPMFLAASIRENLLLAYPDATDDELQDALERVFLWDVLVRNSEKGQHPLDYMLPRNPADRLAGGQLRRLAVARALLMKPSVVLLDEPTTNLGETDIPAMADALRKAFKGITVLLVDPDANFVYQMADQVCCLKSGKFVDVGSPKELTQRDSLFKKLLTAREWSTDDPEQQES